MSENIQISVIPHWKMFSHISTFLTIIILSDSLNINGDNMTDLDKELLNIVTTFANDFVYPFFNNNENNVELLDKYIPEFEIGQKNEDANLSLEGLFTKYKRPYEIHEVTTQDGYILKMFRVLGNSTPVLLIPGIFGSADDYATAGPESGLVYGLSNLNYDVWLGNPRGNKYSRHHQYLQPSSAAFWDFTWHEIGVYDLPAMIDYILNITGKPSLSCIGHSQGVTSFFVLASERPEYNEKITHMYAFSPVAYLTHTKSLLIKFLAFNYDAIYTSGKALGIYEVGADDRLTRLFKRIFCQGLGILTEIICTNISYFLIGFDNQQVNVTNLPVIFGHFPAGSSLKQLIHYAQVINSDRFAKYDYGFYENIKVYGTLKPPEYNLSQITTPLHLFYSFGDWLTQPEDFKKLSVKLNSVVESYKVPLRTFNHEDFMYAKDVVSLVYSKLFKSLQSN